MRYLGIDLGTKYVGLSISDSLGIIASSYKTLQFTNNEDLALEIKALVELEKIGGVVLGLPKNMNNSIGQRALSVQEFKVVLSNVLGIEVIFQDERLSSVEANNYLIDRDVSRKKRKKIVDKAAASIILQTYLDTKKKERN